MEVVIKLEETEVDMKEVDLVLDMPVVEKLEGGKLELGEVDKEV